MSKGEEKIAFILRSNNIAYEAEKTFIDLQKGKYRYDFYLPYLNILIEFDGAQHLEFNQYFHKNRQGFIQSQGRDRRKNSYALERGIPLYRIPYYDLDKINTFNDLLQNKYRVKDKYHNDKLRAKKMESIL